MAKHELGSGRSSGTIGYELCFESKQSFPLKVAFHLHRGPHMTSEKLQGRDWVSARERHTALAVRLLWQVLAPSLSNGKISNICKILQDFGGLVLGCIKTKATTASDRDLGDLYTESGQTLQGSFSAVSKSNFASK